MVPINKHGLLYSFQSLTGDGNYYVAAVLPVNLSVAARTIRESARLSE